MKRENLDIFLTDKEQQIFNKFLNDDFAVLSKEEYLLLSKHRLLINSINGKSDWFDLPDQGPCQLSDFGK